MFIDKKSCKRDIDEFKRLVQTKQIFLVLRRLYVE